MACGRGKADAESGRTPAAASPCRARRELGGGGAGWLAGPAGLGAAQFGRPEKFFFVFPDKQKR